MRRPLCAICLAVIVMVAVYTGLHPPEIVDYDMVSGRMVQVTGRIYAKEYKLRGDSPVLILFLKPQELLFHQQKIPFQDNFICTVEANQKEPAMGSIVSVRGILTAFEPATNPGQFDEAAYYASLEISAELYQCSLLWESIENDPIKEALWKVRRKLSGMLFSIFSKEDAAVLSTMLLGDKSGLMTETKDLYKNAGILHILAISGLHISFLGMGLYQLLRKLRMPLYPTCVISILLMIAYGMMVGMPVCAVRAIGMFCIRILAVCLKRTYDMITALLFCATVSLLVKPYLLLQTGFLLSYLGILAILLLKPLLQPNVKKCPEWLMGLVTTLSITIFTLPLQLSAFYEVSIYSPLLNLLVLPLVGIVIAAGLLCLPLYWLIPPLVKPVAFGVHLILKIFAGGAKLVNHLPGARIIPGKPSLPQIIIFYGILLALLCLRRLTYRHRIGLLCGAVMLLTVRFTQHLQITFLDVGQGDCAVITLPRGQTWLIDGGSLSVSGVGTYRIEPYLKSMGISALDAVFLSHGDRDHINGVEEILQNGDIPIKLLVLSFSGQTDMAEDDEFDLILQTAEKKDIPIMHMFSGMEWKSEGVSVQCLHPGKNTAIMDGNASSQVLRLQYGKFSALFTGDVEGEGEYRMMEALYQKEAANITLLKVAHHGSRNTTSSELLDLLHPRYAVISCGKKNAYGHPHKELLDRLLEAETEICITMENGAVTFTTDGEWIKVDRFIE